LDGYFEGAKSWELDWHKYAWDKEMEQISIKQLRSAGMLLFGRATYNGMADYWSTAKGEDADIMNNIPKVVFSRTLDKAEWTNTTLVKENATTTVRNLKRNGERNIFVFGSADFSASLMNDDLFDEYRLAITPVVLGNGKPLFSKNLDHLKLKLLDARSLASGCVILRYERDQSQEAPHSRLKK
jgi:dihydrofolate reductase